MKHDLTYCKQKGYLGFEFGMRHAIQVCMIIGNSVSEAGNLLLLGAALLATSLVLRRLLKATIRVFHPNPKVDLRPQENLIK
jgi:hypothetical protein